MIIKMKKKGKISLISVKPVFENVTLIFGKFNDDKIHRIVLKGDQTIDFLKNNSVNWLINNYKKESIEIFKGEKFYNKDRNKEIFFLIEKGAEISNGKLFNFFKSKI